MGADKFERLVEPQTDEWFEREAAKRGFKLEKVGAKDDE